MDSIKTGENLTINTQSNLNFSRLQEAKSPQDYQKLKFQYNGGLIKNNKKKIIKGVTMGEYAFNQLLKNKDLQMFKHKLKKSDSSNSNTLESLGNGSNLSKNNKVAIRFKKNVQKGGRTHLKKCKTFQTNDIFIVSPKESDRNAFKSSNVTNLNIHININKVSESNRSVPSVNLRKNNSKLEKDNLNSQPTIQVSKKYEKKKSEQMWSLCRRTIKMAKKFTEHDVTKIDLASDLAEHIAEYKKQKEKIYVNQNTAENQSLIDFMQKTELDKELIRVHLKESAQKIITEGSKDFRKDLDSIFEKNPERFLMDARNPRFLFNQPLPDTKKTLLYSACQEGNFEIVNFLLDKNLNPSVKSKTDENEWESCLEVAARWNYGEIVKLLLDKGNLSEVEIRQILKNKNIKKSMKDIINNYLNKTSKKKKGCNCF